MNPSNIDALTSALTASPVVMVVCGFLFIMALVWICVPFALFGLKGRIAKLTQAVHEVGTLLEYRLAPQPRPGEDIKIRHESDVRESDDRDIFASSRLH